MTTFKCGATFPPNGPLMHTKQAKRPTLGSGAVPPVTFDGATEPRNPRCPPIRLSVSLGRHEGGAILSLPS
jgi:hypothetical protein